MNTLESLARTFVEGHPQNAAHAIEQMDTAEAAKILEKLSFRLNGLLDVVGFAAFLGFAAIFMSLPIR